jgi:hypothetical protein
MARTRVERLVRFGALMLILAGAFNVIDGLVALLNPDFYFDDDLLISSVTAWGWVFIVWGAVQLALGVLILYGSTIALWPGVAAAAGNAVIQILFMAHYPLWGAIVLIADGLVIYAFITHGMETGIEQSPTEGA